MFPSVGNVYGWSTLKLMLHIVGWQAQQQQLLFVRLRSTEILIPTYRSAEWVSASEEDGQRARLLYPQRYAHSGSSVAELHERMARHCLLLLINLEASTIVVLKPWFLFWKRNVKVPIWYLFWRSSETTLRYTKTQIVTKKRDIFANSDTSHQSLHWKTRKLLEHDKNRVFVFKNMTWILEIITSWAR